MPEGDAVRRTALRLDEGLAGRSLVSTDFRWPSLATVDLAGATVHGTETYGKHLLTRLDHDGRLLTLHTHLKMEGSWRIYRSGRRPAGGVAGGATPDADRGPRSSLKRSGRRTGDTPGQFNWDRPGRTARVVLTTADVQAVGFSLGLVELLPTAEEHTVVGHLGPDLLRPNWDESDALERLRADPSRPLGEALLDQTVIAGLGTIYVSEACFVHGVNPLTPVGDLADPPHLLRRAAQMLRAGVDHGRPVTTGDRRQPLWVYRRQRQPCRRCGTTLEAGQLGGAGRERTTYWCPSCQPVPA